MSAETPGRGNGGRTSRHSRSPEQVQLYHTVDVSLEDLLAQAPEYCSVEQPAGDEPLVLECTEHKGLGSLARPGLVSLAVAVLLGAGLFYAEWWPVRAILAVLLLLPAVGLAAALIDVIGLIWGRARLRLEPDRIVGRARLLGFAPEAEIAHLGAAEKVLLRQIVRDGEVRGASIWLLGREGQCCDFPVADGDRAWLARLLAAHYGLPLKVVRESLGPFPEGAARAELPAQTFRELAQQAPDGAEVTVQPGGGGAAVEAARSGCLFVLVPLTAVWLAATGGVLWLVVATRGLLVPALIGLLFLGMLYVCWKLAVALAEAGWGTWRLRIEPDRLVGERILWGSVTEVGSADMRDVDGIRVRRSWSEGEIFVDETKLLGPPEQEWPELPCICDELWQARLVAAYYRLPLELVDHSPGFIPVVSREKLEHDDEPPTGCEVRRQPADDGAELAAVVEGRIRPGGLIVGLLVIFAGAALVPPCVWLLPRALSAGLTWNVLIPTCLAIGAAAFGLYIILSGLQHIGWMLAGRALIHSEGRELVVSRELFGFRWRTRRIARSELREIYLEKPVQGLQLCGSWNGARRVLPRGTPYDVSVWLGKVIALWADVPLYLPADGDGE